MKYEAEAKSAIRRAARDFPGRVRLRWGGSFSGTTLPMGESYTVDGRVTRDDGSTSLLVISALVSPPLFGSVRVETEVLAPPTPVGGASPEAS